MIVDHNGARQLKTLVEGGSGIHSMEKDMPADLPEHFEAGTLPAPAIAGLSEGVKWVQKTGIQAIHEHECALWSRAYTDLCYMKGVRVYDNTPGSILLFNADHFPPSRLAAELSRAGICTRSGLHCAPFAHDVLRTGADGAVRVSFGAMNTLKDVGRFVDVLHGILRSQ